MPFMLNAQTKTLTVQVLVVGGSTGGTAAGIQCAASGAHTVIVEQTNMLGGMLTAAAVSCTDGNDLLHSGMWQQFREALYAHYGTTGLESGWVSETCFEPHVADSIFKAWAANEKNLSVLYGWYFDKTLKSGNKVTGAEFINTKNERLIVHAKIVIDATDLGDVFANAGAAYDLGMDDPKQSGEKEAGGKNNIIQDLTWAAVLKDYGKDTDKTILMPPGYDAKKYFCSTADAPCHDTPYPFSTQKVLDYGRLTSPDSAHPKYMFNWPIHGNDYYLDVVKMKPAEREAEYIKAKNQTLGFIYFLQTQLGFKNIGLANDEVNNGMAWIPYNREGRRVKGVVRLNINHIKNPYNYTLYRTGIAVGDYPVDHHHNQYPGKVPEIKFPKIPSFNIPLGALIPEKTDGLIVCDKGISVSNIANGCTRLQPVVLLTGQAAGILAAQCMIKNIQPRNINLRDVQNELLKNKCFLEPFCDVSPGDPAWEAVQRISAMGIIKGIGVSEGWENKTFFYPDSLMKYTELEQGLSSIKPDFMHIKTFLKYKTTSGYVNTKNLYEMINMFTLYRFKSGKPEMQECCIAIADSAISVMKSLSIKDVSETRWLTRSEVAAILNFYIDFFKAADCDLKGVVKAE